MELGIVIGILKLFGWPTSWTAMPLAMDHVSPFEHVIVGNLLTGDGLGNFV